MMWKDIPPILRKRLDMGAFKKIYCEVIRDNQSFFGEGAGMLYFGAGDCMSLGASVLGGAGMSYLGAGGGMSLGTYA
ncbi:MAG: hypothetical protein F4010_02810, partial [Cenarchaeum sp. SB0669_bin_11]|nr:hypothetical protein [Cenarchaeum sp. SB0669_bin_11]